MFHVEKKGVAIAMHIPFEEIKFILEEHLSAINGNTQEIQALFDYIHQVEVKVDKLSARLDSKDSCVHHKPQVAPLTTRERGVFLVLYTTDMPLSYEEISGKTQMPLGVVRDAITSLVVKGIPFSRTLVNDQVFLQLDSVFKERQAKENVINLSLESFMR